MRFRSWCCVWLLPGGFFVAPFDSSFAQTQTPGRIEGAGRVTADGAALYTIPIWVSPGRAGVQPSLALGYSSRSGNGWMGPGWGLHGLSRISRSRCTQANEGAAEPIQFADGPRGDRYALDGQRLVVSGGPLGILSEYGGDGTEYRTEQDSQVKVISHAPDEYGPTSFTVYERNGAVVSYGAAANSRLEGKRVAITTSAGGTGSAQQWHEDHTATVRHSWALDRLSDRSGNYFRVEYELEDDGRFGYDLRPARIHYTGFTSPPGSPAENLPTTRSVEFTYALRPDATETFVSGLRLIRAQRLTRIDVRGPTSTGPNGLLRRYELGYLVSPATGRSLLATVTERDGAGVGKPPTVFSWNPGDTGFADHLVATLTPGDAIIRQPNDPVAPQPWAAAWQVADVNGDGRDDLLGVGPAALLANSTNSGAPLWVPAGSTLVTGAVGYVESGNPLSPDRYLDLNGDGVPDRLALEPRPPAGGQGSNPPGFRRNAIHLSGPNGFSRLEEEQTFSVLTRPPYALDLDGDGLADLVQPVPEPSGSGYVWRYRINTAGTLGPWMITTIAAPLPSSLGQPDPFFGLAFDPTGAGKAALLVAGNRLLRLAAGGLESASVALPMTGHCDPLFLDVNGDGLLDWIGRPSAGAISLAINTGNGFAAPITWALPSPYQDSFPLKCDLNESAGTGARALDFNGDGRQDILLMAGFATSSRRGAPRKLVVLLSNGRGFDPRPLDVAAGDQSGNDLWKQSQVLDVNGDGLADLAQRVGATLHVYTRKGGRPDVLARVTDGLGAFEAFDYIPIAPGPLFSPMSGSRYPLSDLKSGLWVVSEHHVDNGLSGQRTWSYGFANGRSDLQTGEWLGFGSRTISDPLLGATTTITMDNATRVGTWYPYAGRPTSTVARARTEIDRGKAIYRAHSRTFSYQFVQPTPGSWFVYPRETDERHVESLPGARPTLVARTVHRELQDDFGNVRYSETESYPIAGGSPHGSPTRNKLEAVHDNFTASWLIGLTRKLTVTSMTPDSRLATRTIEHDYDATTALLRKTRLEPQAAGLAEADQSGFFQETTLEHSAHGLTTSIRVDGSGESRVHSTAYDSLEHAFPVEQRNALNHVSRTEYDPGLGLPTLRRDPNQVALRTQYDGFGRTRGFVSDGGADTTVVYDTDAAGHFRVKTWTRGKGTTELVFDRLQREISRSWDGANGTRALTETTYDLAGRLAAESVPRWVGQPARWERFEYDDMGRMIRNTHPDSTSVKVAYAGTRIQLEDERGNRQFVVLDEQGRTARAVEVDDTNKKEITTLLEYGPFDALSKVTDPSGQPLAVETDALGRRTKLVDPNVGTVTALYDAFGDAKSVTNGAGHATRTTRDALGRPTTIVTSDGTAQMVWDTAAHGIGKLAQATSPSRIITRSSYDTFGRLAGSTTEIDQEAFAFYFGYDPLGRLSTYSYPAPTGQSALAVTLTYSPTGFAEKITTTGGGVTWNVQERDARGRVTAERFGNGLSTARTFDERGHLRTIITQIRAGTPKTQDLEYEWHPNGSLFRRHEHTGAWAEEFGYDSLSRLTSWDAFNLTHQTRVRTQYGFNDAGNLLWRTLPDALPPLDRVTYGYGENGAGPSALTSLTGAAGKQSYGYDAAGRQASGPDRSISYSSLNLPVTIARATGKTSFRYDVAGRRVLKTSGSDSVVSVAGLYERRTRNGAITHAFMIPGVDRSVAQLVSATGAPTGDVFYLHDDHLGSIESVTDAKGVRLEQRSYDPFGNPQNPADRGRPLVAATPSAIRLGFTAHAHDEELGLIEMGGRWYDPVAGHFLSADPVVANPGHGQSWNRYAYARNSPLTLVDRFGFDIEDSAPPPSDSGWAGDDDSSYDDGTPASGETIVRASRNRGSSGGWDSGTSHGSSSPDENGWPAPAADDKTTVTVQGKFGTADSFSTSTFTVIRVRQTGSGGGPPPQTIHFFGNWRRVEKETTSKTGDALGDATYYLYIDSPMARLEKLGFFAVGNAFAMIGATVTEAVLMGVGIRYWSDFGLRERTLYGPWQDLIHVQIQPDITNLYRWTLHQPEVDTRAELRKKALWSLRTRFAADNRLNAQETKWFMHELMPWVGRDDGVSSQWEPALQWLYQQGMELAPPPAPWQPLK